MLLQLHVISFHVSIFDKTKKNLVGPTLVSFGSKTQEQDFFKRCSPSLFQVGRHPNFAQKKTKFLRAIPEKNSGKTEKRTEGISLDLHFVGPR